MTFRQLDLWWVDLEPTRGAETQKARPCVIVSADLVNHESRTVIVAPLLPNHKTWPFAVNLTPTTKNGLDKPRHINLKQVRAVDVSRISNRQGEIESSYRPAIEAALRVIFEL